MPSVEVFNGRIIKRRDHVIFYPENHIIGSATGDAFFIEMRDFYEKLASNHNIAVFISLDWDDFQNVNDGHGNGKAGPAGKEVHDAENLLLGMEPMGTSPAQKDRKLQVLLLVDAYLFSGIPPFKEAGNHVRDLALFFLFLRRLDTVLFPKIFQLTLGSVVFLQRDFPLNLLFGFLSSRIRESVGVFQVKIIPSWVTKGCRISGTLCALYASVMRNGDGEIRLPEQPLP